MVQRHFDDNNLFVIGDMVLLEGQKLTRGCIVESFLFADA